MAKVTSGDVVKGVSIARKILAFLADNLEKLPKWLRPPVKWGRDNGLYQQGQGPNLPGPRG